MKGHEYMVLWIVYYIVLHCIVSHPPNNPNEPIHLDRRLEHTPSSIDKYNCNVLFISLTGRSNHFIVQSNKKRTNSQTQHILHTQTIYSPIHNQFMIQ